MRQRTALNNQLTGGTLRLRLGLSLLRRRQMLMMMLPLLVLLGLLVLHLDDAAAEDMAGRVAQSLTTGDLGERLEAWTMLLLTLLAVLVGVVTRRASLEVSSLGLQAQVPRGIGLGLQQMTTGRFRVGWEQIDAAELRTGPRRGALLGYLQAARLVLRTGERELLFSPFLWVNAAGADHRLSLAEALRSGRTFDDAIVERSPLLRALRERGLAIHSSAADSPAAPSSSSFDLTRHRGLVGQMLVLALAGGYAMIDGFATGPYLPLQPLPYLPFVVTGVLACAATLASGRGAPAAERIGVGTLAVIALVAAVYPALNRINGWTGEPVTVGYAVVAPARLAPPAAQLPPIDLARLRLDEYWAQYDPDEIHPMTLVQGIGGYWQLDTRPLFERTRRFYREL